MTPDRRTSLTTTLKHNDHKFDVTFGIVNGSVIECFYCETNAVKHGSEMQAVLSDACIAISKRIENGESWKDVAISFGENRAPGEERGPPASALGTIAWAGARLQMEI